MAEFKSKALRLEFDLENFIDGIPGSFYWKDQNGVYLGCNQTVLEKANLRSRDDIIGKTDFEVWPEMAEEIRRIDLDVMQNRKSLEVEETIILKSGELMYFSSVKSPLYDEQKNIVGVIGNSTDITELKIAKHHAEAASQAKTQFLALMSHELRTPLSGIISTASMLVEADDMSFSPEEVKNFSRIIAESGAYLLSTIDNILDFAKLEADRFIVVDAPLNLSEVLEDISNLLRVSANQKNIALNVRFIPEVPPQILSDSRILRHILINLIGNSIKYTDKGRIEVEVHTLAIHSQNTVTLKINVIDSGIGIAHDKLDFIFDKFSQVEQGYTHKTSRLGTGLGLSIVKKMVKLLNGKIQVESEIGKGSCFSIIVDFPIVKKENKHDK